MNYMKLGFCILLASSGTAIGHSIPDYKDAQLCTNAYNKLWHTFDTVKADFRGNPTAQAAKFNVEFPKFLTQDFQLTINNLPIDANSDQVVTVTANGLPEVVIAASDQITSWGQHHVAGPFSFKVLPESTKKKSVYLMTTRDIDFTNTPNNQGCATYLAQKSMTCTVEKVKGNIKKAMLKKMDSYVVTTYVMPLENCKLWMSAPVEDFPTQG